MNRRANIALINIIFITLALVLANFIFFSQVRQERAQRAKARQDMAISMFWQLLQREGRDFTLAGDNLLLGNRPVGSELPAIVGKTFDCVASIYQGNVRIATSQPGAAGEPAGGTEMKTMVRERIYVRKAPYRGKYLIDGDSYLSAYDPIFDRDGNAIGAIAIDLNSNKVFASLDHLRNDVILGSVLVEIILIFFAILLSREQKRQQQLLRESEQSYRLLFTKMLNGSALLEGTGNDCGEVTDYRFLQVNAAFEQHTGLQARILPGRTVREILPELADSWIRRFRGVAETGVADHFESYSAELRRWLEISAYSPRPGQIVAMVADITQRKRSEEKLEEVARILSTCSGETVFLNLAAHLSRLLPIDGVFVGEYFSEEPARISTLAVYKYGAEAENFEYQLSGTPSAQVLGGGYRIYSEGVCDLFPDASVLAELQADGYAGVPLKLADGTILGVLALFSRQSLHLAATDESILHLFAQRAAVELHRLKAQHALLASEHRYRTLFETTGTATIVIEENTSISLANREFESLSQYSRQEIAGKSFAAFFDPESRDKMLSFHRQRRLDPTLAPSVYECSLLCRDGSCRHLLAHVSLFPGTRRSIASLHDITQLKRFESSLREQVVFLQTLLDTIPSPVFFKDRSGRYLGCNHAFEEFVGRTQADLIGKTVFDVSPVHLAAKYFAMDEELFNHPGIQSYCAPVRYRDDSQHEVIFYKATFNDRAGAVGGLVGIMLDVTELKRSEAALKASEERFHQLFTQHPDAVLLLAADGSVILDANPAAAAIFGYAHKDFLACTPAQLIEPSDYTTVQAALSGDRPIDFRFDRVAAVRKDGSLFIISFWGKTILLHDNDVIFCSLRDVTDKIQMEETIRATQAKLIHTNKMTSLGILTSSMGHEINNPNSFIAVNAAMLADIWNDSLPVLRRYSAEHGDFSLGGLPFTEMETKVPRLCSGIVEGSRRIDAIVKGLKNFVRDGKGRRHERISVNTIVEQAAGILWHHLHKYTDHFSLELGGNLPHLRGNAQQLEQVVINLIMNALQALPDKHSAVSVLTREENNRVVVEVRDGGKGMTAEIMKKLAEPFFTTRMEEGGSGLGLYISTSIIAEHEGTIEFDSAPGVGTTVTVRLPVAPAGEGVEATGEGAADQMQKVSRALG